MRESKLNFKKVLLDYKNFFELNINDFYIDGPKNMIETSNFVMSAKGKRVRPILSMMSCTALGGKIEDSIDVAIAIELLHNFTLVHDDIMDDDNLRHGQPTVHEKWDIGTDVLTGDSLLWLSLHALKNIKKNREKIILSFIDAIKLVCEGQAYDKMFESKENITLDEYEQMIGMKTGYMIGLCSHLGSICADADLGTQIKMQNYGLEIGKAYQIQDDYMEIYSNQEVMKKSLNSDVELNKKTYMICLAIKNRKFDVIDILKSKKSSLEKIKDLRNYFEKTGIKQQTIKEINKTFNNANKILDTIKFKVNYLHEVNRYLINRKY